MQSVVLEQDTFPICRDTVDISLYWNSEGERRSWKKQEQKRNWRERIISQIRGPSRPESCIWPTRCFSDSTTQGMTDTELVGASVWTLNWPSKTLLMSVSPFFKCPLLCWGNPSLGSGDSRISLPVGEIHHVIMECRAYCALATLLWNPLPRVAHLLGSITSSLSSKIERWNYLGELLTIVNTHLPLSGFMEYGFKGSLKVLMFWHLLFIAFFLYAVSHLGVASLAGKSSIYQEHKWIIVQWFVSLVVATALGTWQPLVSETSSFPRGQLALSDLAVDQRRHHQSTGSFLPFLVPFPPSLFKSRGSFNSPPQTMLHLFPSPLLCGFLSFK